MGKKIPVYHDLDIRDVIIGYADLMERQPGMYDGIYIPDEMTRQEKAKVFITKRNFWRWELEDEQIQLLKAALAHGRKGLYMTVEREIADFFEKQLWILKFYPTDKEKKPYICKKYVRVKTKRKAMHLPDEIDKETMHLT